MAEPQTLPPIPLFAALRPSERSAVVSRAAMVEVDGGEEIFSQGDPGDAMYIVLAGRVAASGTLPDGGERDVASFLPGDFFGEMGIFEARPRSASCRSLEPALLLRLEGGALRSFCEEDPDAAVRLLETLAGIVTRRLREKSGLLASMVEWGETAAHRAFTDDTTGAYNRRYFDQALLDSCEAAIRDGSLVTVAMADVDDFRRVNERLERSTGDAVLARIASLARRELREGDTLARYGGDELALVLPRRSQEEAVELCSRLRLAVDAQEDWRGMGVPLTVTVSLGCASAAGATPGELLGRADAALYRAKRSGKNCVAAG